MSPDTGNALFELIGAWFTWKNAAQLRRDRRILGVYWPATAFFTAWGLWNLYYYPALGQWLSVTAGAILVSGNLAWLWLAYGVLRPKVAA